MIRRTALTRLGVSAGFTGLLMGTAVAVAAGGASAQQYPPLPPPASPSPSAPASPSASPSASVVPSAPATTPPATQPPPTPPGCLVAAQARLNRTTITATGAVGVTVTATPNSIVDLLAYTRPSTTLRVVRSAELGADGTADFLLTPPANTRIVPQQRGCAFGGPQVINVRTAISIAARRNGPRNYTFSGDSLPARPGGLIISLYRVTNDGRQVLTAQTRASASTGDWVINRRFTGSGVFGFVARTGQDLQNAPGSSNVRRTVIH